jgi:hypothetical protein
MLNGEKPEHSQVDRGREPEMTEMTQPQPEKARGGCLTAFLIVMLILNPLVAIYYLVAGDSLATVVPGFTPGMMILFALLGFANLAFALAVWRWKRWGVYGFGVSAIAAFIANMAIGLPITSALGGLVGLIIMVALVSRIWDQME